MDEAEVPAATEQEICASSLAAGVVLAMVALVAGLTVYLSGALPAAVPLERLTELWGLPAAEYLARSGAPAGWHWAAISGHGDTLSLATIALLLCVSTLCLVRLLPVFARQRDWAYFAITLLEIGVLALAASGVLATGH